MLTRGWGKLVKLVDGNMNLGNPIDIGKPASLVLTVFTKFLCAVVVIIGYKTRLTAIPLSITMAVAAFVVYRDDPWGKKEMAIFNSSATSPLPHSEPENTPLPRSDHMRMPCLSGWIISGTSSWPAN